MKMPFGKYKGKELNQIPYSYIDWLQCKKLHGPLKTEIEKIVASDAFHSYRMREIQIRERNFQDSYDGVKYEEDMSFWSRTSPAATYDRIQKYGIKVSEDDWKYLMYQLEKKGY